MDHLPCIRTVSVRLLVRRPFARGLSVTLVGLSLVTLWQTVTDLRHVRRSVQIKCLKTSARWRS